MCSNLLKLNGNSEPNKRLGKASGPCAALAFALLASLACGSHAHERAADGSDGFMSAEATHIHIAKEAIIPGETLVYFGPRSGSSTGKAELRLRIKRLSMARGGVLMASFTLSGGRFAEVRSTADYLSIPEPKIAAVFRKPLEEQESNGGRTVSYRLAAQSSISRESRETEFVFRPHRIILTDAERVSVTVVLEIVDDGSDEGLPAPEVLGTATQTLAHVDSLVPGFKLQAPSHPAAPIAFPSAQALTPNPRNAVAHAVRAITGGATDIYSASKLADALVPVGFLEATSANPGHCLFHSSRALSVVEGGN